jgi:hypothetical protein
MWRARFEIDEWQKLNRGTDWRVPVWLPGKGDVWLFITHVPELPPIVWATRQHGRAVHRRLDAVGAGRTRDAMRANCKAARTSCPHGSGQFAPEVQARRRTAV